MIIKTQKCNRCGDVRPLSKFEVHPQAASGYRRTCKDCVSLYSKKTGPKPERMNIPADKRDPLAYHPNHSATLSPYYRKIIGGSFAPRNPELTPSRTLLWSENTFWGEKPVYIRETGNKKIKSKGV